MLTLPTHIPLNDLRLASKLHYSLQRLAQSDNLEDKRLAQSLGATYQELLAQYPDLTSHLLPQIELSLPAQTDISLEPEFDEEED